MPKQPLPLPTLLSHVLVAFTIEFDNEFEQQMPHRTSTGRHSGAAPAGPWLVSMAMWSNLMRCVSAGGRTVSELQRLCGTERLLLNGMERWGYVVVEPDRNDPRTKPPRGDWIVRPTAKGRQAQEMWRPLFGVIEERWRKRFGKTEIDLLRRALWAIVRRLDAALPEYMPVVGYGLVAEALHRERLTTHVRAGDGSDVHLPALLSQALHAFTIEFEEQSPVSLAIGANVMRLLDEKGTRVRELPRLSGVSKESIAMALGFLEKRGYAVIEPHPTESRTPCARLTREGRAAYDLFRRRLSSVEEEWKREFGADAIRDLRKSLCQLVGEPTAENSPLFQGLKPHPFGWRASVPKPDTLPHHPMVLHRGGYPDGA